MRAHTGGDWQKISAYPRTHSPDRGQGIAETSASCAAARVAGDYSGVRSCDGGVTERECPHLQQRTNPDWILTLREVRYHKTLLRIRTHAPQLQQLDVAFF